MANAPTFALPSGRPKTAAAPVRERDSSVMLAVGLAAFMAVIIAISVIAHTGLFALVALPVFVGAVLFFSIKDTPTALAFYFAYTALEGMYKYVTGFSQAIYVIKPILAIIIFAGWIMVRRTRGEPLQKLPMGVLLGLFVGWGILEIFNPLGSGPVASLVTMLVWYVIPIGFYVVGYNSRFTSRQMVTLLYVLVMVCTVVSAFAFIQYMMGRGWTLSHVPGYSNLKLAMWTGADEAGNKVISFRPASTTSAEGFATLWSNLGALTSLGLILLPRISPARRALLLVCLLTNIGGLIVSGVRLFVLISIVEVFLILILTSTSAAALRRNLALGVVVTILAMLGFGAAQGVSQGAIASRYAETFANPYAKYTQERQGGVVGQLAWLQGFFIQYPLGIGFQRGVGGEGGQQDVASGRIVMNRETQFAAIGDDMGLPGLILFSFLVVAMLFYGKGAFQKLKDVQIKTLAAILLIATFGYTIGYWGGQMLIAVGDYIWLFVGVLFTLPGLVRRQSAPLAAGASGPAVPGVAR